MKLNQLTGADFMVARTHIGLSLSGVAKLIDVNRNTLSLFEKEKMTLTLSEKQRLADCYQERGYDFDTDNTVDDSAVKTRYQDSQKQAEAVLNTDNPSAEDMQNVMLSLADNVHDLVALANLDNAASNNETPVEYLDLPESYYKERQEITAHLILDKRGNTRGKVGLFKEDGEERTEKLIAMLAMQTLTQLAAEEPEMLSLDREELDDDSDMARVLDTVQEWVSYDALKDMLVA